MFEAAPFDAMYKQFLGPLARTILIAVNNGVGFNVYPPRSAWVTDASSRDLVTDSSVREVDVKCVMLADQLPAGITKLELKDRIIIGDMFYSIVNFDPYSRAIGGQILAYNIMLKGGGKYVSGGLYTIVSESGDPLITEVGDFGMITE
jgi:hypothetical protein